MSYVAKSSKIRSQRTLLSGLGQRPKSSPVTQHTHATEGLQFEVGSWETGTFLMGPAIGTKTVIRVIIVASAYY